MPYSRRTRAWPTQAKTQGIWHKTDPTPDESIAAAIWELGMAMRMVVAAPSIGLPIAIAHGRERLRRIEDAEAAKGNAQSAALIDACSMLFDALDELSEYINGSAVVGARRERHRIIEILAHLADAAEGDPTAITAPSLPHHLTDVAPVPPLPPLRGTAPSSPLTQREQEVLALLATGADNREIASFLTISQKTAKKHVCNLMEKLGVSDRLKAVVKGLELGLVRAG